MKKMKKSLAFALAVVTASSITLSACDKSENPTTTDPYYSVSSSEQQESGGKVAIQMVHNGKVTADVSEYQLGQTVTFTLTPDEGYILKSIFVNGEDQTAAVVDGKLVMKDVQKKRLNVVAEFEAIEYGTLKIEDVVVAVGDTKTIIPIFTDDQYAEEVRYTFRGDGVSIDGNTVQATEAEMVITVTAETTHHRTVFNIMTVESYGIRVCDVYSWEGYAPSAFNVCFEGVDKTDITYEYKESEVILDEKNQTIIGKKIGTFTVKVKAGEYETSFQVTHNKVTKSGDKWNSSGFDAKMELLKKEYIASSTNQSVLFIGDSFFDENFWSNFYDIYEGKDAILSGIGSTTTYDWEQYAIAFLKEVQPKTIVMNIGTNNLFDDGESATAGYESLQRLFQLIHSELPETQIYYFSIAVRGDNALQQKKISKVNELMKMEFCRGKEWIKFVDVTEDVGLAQLKSDMIHPRPETYLIYAQRLEEAGLVIPDKK